MNEARPTSSELRERIVAEWVLPRARAFFEREPRAQSVLFLVAQYWADEAEDAVHGELLACVDRDPAWPECASFARNPIGDPPEADDAFDDALREDAFEAQYSTWIAIDAALRHDPRWPAFLDENGDMIVAFASYCEEGASQEDAFTTAYTPYCIVRRDVEGVEIVGAMLRPEWEDRWDVVDAGGSMAAADAEASLDEELGIVTYREPARSRRQRARVERRFGRVVVGGVLLALLLVLLALGR